jgi:hypothetical protein
MKPLLYFRVLRIRRQAALSGFFQQSIFFRQPLFAFRINSTPPAILVTVLFLLILPCWEPGGQVTAQSCSITLQPTVSGCYQNSGSKATISVEVSWANATISSTANDASDAITVTYAGLTRTIDPGAYTSPGSNGVIVSPQVVAFEVDLATTASGQTVAAFFTANAGCSATSVGITLPAACPPTACGGNNVGGQVFNDFNADGVKDGSETSGVSGVIIKAYDCNGTLVGTATTDAFGIYSITSLQASHYPLRVEFTNLPTYAGQGTLKGSSGHTTVQFTSTPSCSMDLGVLDPTDYCQNNPKLVIPCYVNGDPLVAGTASNSDAVVSFDYTASGYNSALMAHAPAQQVGALWGMAYNKFTKKIFSSATVKRHAGLGPLGLGGIYIADFSNTPANGSTFNYSNFLDVSTIGINVGSIADNAARGLSGDKTQPSADNQGYLAVGRAGIGGIDLSADGNLLYLTNLFDNKLYEINITAYNTSGTLPTAANVKSYDMRTGINCTGGNLHAWGVKVHKGKVYTGMVCDASISQNKSDLRAFVQELNGTTVSTIFEFPLTYPKGFPVDGGGGLYTDLTGWYPWTDDWSKKLGPSTVTIHPEPIFSSIEFDIDGSMILALADRTGLQSGYNNYSPAGSSDPLIYASIAAGDILRAYSNGTSYVLENNAKAGPTVGYGANNNQGPGFGEFYNDNFLFNGGLAHAENALGGLALRPGSGEVIGGAMDPLDGSIYNAGGVRHFNNTSGLVSSALVVYSTNDTPGTFGKGTGLGDIVVACDIPTYLEIGNRLWIDSDKDGIQDPCELPLANVKVALFSGNTLLAATTSDANGEYYFNTTNAPTMQPNTAYTVRFGTDGASDQYDSSTDVLTVNGERYNATIAFSTAATANGFNDSNAKKSGGFLSASVTTGTAGSVNHSLDAGFHIACPLINCYPTLVSKN